MLLLSPINLGHHCSAIAPLSLRNRTTIAPQSHRYRYAVAPLSHRYRYAVAPLSHRYRTAIDTLSHRYRSAVTPPLLLRFCAAVAPLSLHCCTAPVAPLVSTQSHRYCSTVAPQPLLLLHSRTAIAPLLLCCRCYCFCYRNSITSAIAPAVTHGRRLKRQNQGNGFIGAFQARVSSSSEGCSTSQKTVKVENYKPSILALSDRS